MTLPLDTPFNRSISPGRSRWRDGICRPTLAVRGNSRGGSDPIVVEIGTNSAPSFAAGGAHLDPPYGQGFLSPGLTGSYFTKGLTREPLHLLVIVDTRKVAADSLRSISDYIAMLALTRMGSLDGCSELPSSIDLLSSSCGSTTKPQALTAADTAYLEALYSSDLEANLTIEQRDMRVDHGPIGPREQNRLPRRAASP